MRVYRIHPEYTANLEHYARWVDDGLALMDTPQHFVGPVYERWPTNLAFELSEEGRDCDILFNPDGLVYSERVKEAVAPICKDDAEWLPITVADVGTMYLLHPIKAVPLGSNARFRQHNPGDNIVEIYTYHFDASKELPTCFLIPQPETSAAGKAGYSTRDQLVTDTLYRALSAFRGIDFACIFKSSEEGA